MRGDQDEIHDSETEEVEKYLLSKKATSLIH